MPSAERCDLPNAPSERASTVHPGLFLHGPELKSGEDGFTVGLAAAAALVVENDRTTVLVIFVNMIQISDTLIARTAGEKPRPSEDERHRGQLKIHFTRG